MSKIKELKEKYKHIGASNFNFFLESDKTSTKKYLEYMLKTWDNRCQQSISIRKRDIVDAVNGFEDLLDYIDNKDIYSNEYKNFHNVLLTLEKYNEIRNEKTFVKKDNVFIINETETYILLNPITFLGSIRYGSNTKWCTTSKLREGYFNSYSKGYLAYLIDKTGKRGKGYEKIAFYTEPDKGFTSTYSKYNSVDVLIDEMSLIRNGWTNDELFEIDLFFRRFIFKIKDLRESKKEVEKVIKFLGNLDLNKFKTDFQKLSNGVNIEVEEIIKNLNSFNEQIKDFKINEKKKL